VTDTRLPNGALIRLDPRPYAESGAIVLRVAGGTREETDAAAGQLHLLEHLLLRRTARRTPDALADCIASLGGEVNAETGREHLALLGRAPAPRVAELAALLVECLCEPAFDDDDLALERGAIAAERTFLGQMPPLEALLRLAWPAHPLGRPLLPVEAPHADAATLRALWSAQAVGARLTVALSGAFDAAAVQAAFAPLGELPTGALPTAKAAPRFVPGRYGDLREDRPATLVWALPCLPFEEVNTPCWELAALMLGHRVGARLRENGLAYACAAQPLLFDDAGLIAVQVQAPAGQVARCADAVEACIDALAAGGAETPLVQLARRRAAADARLAIDEPLRRALALASAAHPSPCDWELLVPARLPASAAALRLIL
jgi:predicted Zn-dependent peptidase